MTSNLDPEIANNIHSALSNVMNSDEQLLSRWIVMAEHVFDGGTSISYVTSPGLGTWEVLGMVKATEVVATEHMLAQYADDDEDDDD